MDKGNFFPGSDMQKNGTDRVDFPILKIPEWYILQCTYKCTSFLQPRLRRMIVIEPNILVLES
jgi:hypothetical protein